MILTIDVGNTNIVLGGFSEGKLKFVSRMATEKTKMEDEYAIAIQSILSLYGCGGDSFEGAIVSSVVPRLSPVLKKALTKCLSCKVLVVSPGIKTGLNIKIDDPGTLGSDLVCGAVAALAKYPLPCIIFDLGTAITISALDENGCFLGGTISPGVWLSLEALASGTAQLPHIGFDTVANVIGTNSTDSMKSGAVFGTASMIDGMIEHYSEALGKEAYVVATGGVAPDIVPYCKKKITVDPNLLLEGLLLIYKKNAG